MTPGETNAMLQNFNNTQLHLNVASGYAVMVEIRMRLIGQLCEDVRTTLTKVVDEWMQKNPKHRRPSKNYWECRLEFLDSAIDLIFGEDFSPEESNQLMEFRLLRNKLLHGDFINLMKLMDITPKGRYIDRAGQRNIVEQGDFKEAVLSMERNRGFEEIRIRAVNVLKILDSVLYGLSGVKR